uniref:Uncharacterized protein n=1 Tax=viral metagenome TaxID=1070528 RepID=A0A6C0LEN7_9ZZZZ
MISMIIIIIIIICIFLYAILKEREELGCYRISIAKQCDDNNSVYLLNTKMENGDTREILKKRLISIVSYHEKAGVWRRCYILSLALLFIILIVDKIAHKRNNIYYWIVLLLLFFTVHYFFFNYINYHHFRNLKENAIEIINNFII